MSTSVRVVAFLAAADLAMAMETGNDVAIEAGALTLVRGFRPTS